jgi:hypothetical protein
MTTKEITICGRQVSVAYCYATELSFYKLAGVPLEKADTSNPEHLFAIILSAMLSYYQRWDDEPPVKDTDLLYKASPEELIDAFRVISLLRAEWYKIPKGAETKETKETKSEGDNEKNS